MHETTPTAAVPLPPAFQVPDSLLAQVANGAPVSIAIYDLKGTFLLHIGAGLKKLGLQPNQLVGTNVFELYARVESGLAMLRRAMTSGEVSTDTQDLGDSIWDTWYAPLRDAAGAIVGAMSISTDATERERSRLELAQKLREIEEQNRAIRSMSAPIIEVWQGVLVVPVVGQLDSERAALMLDRLLTEVGQRGARHAIIDLTAVEVVDTSTAQYVLRMVTALRLLGAQAMISGIRATVAQTLVSLQADLSQVTTVATLYAALRRCMQA